MKKTVKTLLFVVIGVLLFNVIHNIFVEKSSYAKWQNWKAQENVDILVLGNSHADCAIVPDNIEASLYETYGEDVSVFNYSVFGMRMEQLYFFAKELLKTQTPDVIVVETFAFCPLEDEYREILARRAFDVFPLSQNKIEAINYCVLEDRWSYYIPFIKYHSRWKELSADDVSLMYDENLWSAAGKEMNTTVGLLGDPGDGFFYQDMSAVMEARPLTDSQKECLDNLILLLEEKDIKLLFVGVPYKRQMELDSVEMVKINNYLEQNYVDGDKIQMLDMNRMWEELQFNYWDLYDEGHVNDVGATKVTNCLIEYIKEHYDIMGMIG